MREISIGEGGKSFRRPSEHQMPEGGSKRTVPERIREKRVGGVSPREVPQARIDAPQEDETIGERRDQREGTTLEQRHPNWPRKISVKLFLSAHITAADMNGLEQQMRNAHIYFYEHEGSDFLRADLQDLANIDLQQNTVVPVDTLVQTAAIRDKSGEVSPIQGGPFESIIRSLYGSKVTVGHCDLMPEDRAVMDALDDAFSQNYRAVSFAKTVSNLREKLKQIVAAQKDRESIITDRFETQLGSLLVAHPELKDQQELTVLMTMGAMHEDLVSRMRAKGISVTPEFPLEPVVLGYEHEVRQSYAAGKEPSDDLMAKAYFEKDVKAVLIGSLTEMFKDSNSLYAYCRHITSLFSMEDIKELHNKHFSRGMFRRSGKDFVKKQISEMNELLAQKGIGKLPTTNSELENAIKSFNMV